MRGGEERRGGGGGDSEGRRGKEERRGGDEGRRGRDAWEYRSSAGGFLPEWMTHSVILIHTRSLALAHANTHTHFRPGIFKTHQCPMPSFLRLPKLTTRRLSS